MSGTRKKAAVALVLLAVGCGWWWGMPLLEKKRAELAAKILASLPEGLQVERVEVSLFCNILRLYGLAGMAANGTNGTLHIKIQELLVSRSGCLATTDSGSAFSIGRLALQEARLHASTQLPGTNRVFSEEIHIKSVVLKNICGDLGGLLAKVRAGAGHEELLADVCGFTAQSVFLAGYSFQSQSALGTVSMSLASFKVGGVTPHSLRDIDLRSLQVHAFNSDVLTVEKIRLAALEVPLPPDLPQEANDAFTDTLTRIFAGIPLVVRDLDLRGAAYHLLISDPITLEQLSGDLEISGQEFLLRAKAKGLEIPVSVYSNLHGTDFFTAGYNHPLRLSGAVHLTAGSKENRLRGELHEAEVEFEDLGFFSAQGEFFLPGDIGEPLFNHGRLVLEDRGFLEQYFAAQAQGERRHNRLKLSDAAVMRKNAVHKFIKQAEKTQHSDMTGLLRAAAALLQNSGRLTIVVAPETPLALSRLPRLLRAPNGALNLHVEYDPN